MGRLFLGRSLPDSSGMDTRKTTQDARSLPQTVRADEAARLLGIGKSTLWRYARASDFPKARRLSPRCTVFDVDELLAWRDSKIVE